MYRGPAPAGADGGAKKLKAKLVCLDDSMLAVSQKGFAAALKEGPEQVIGREKTNAIFIDSVKVSRKHAAVYAVEDGWGIRDLNSTNGVFVNGKRVTDARLNAGDSVKLGDIPFRFEVERPEAPAAGAGGLERFRELGDGESERTMMFGDVRASSKLLAAQEAKEPSEADTPAPRKPAAPVAKPAVKRGGRAEIDATTVMDLPGQAPPAKKFSIVKTAFFTLIGAIVVGGVYFGFGMLRESNIVESKRDAVNRFVREAAVSEDPKQFVEERARLGKLRQELLTAIAEAPDKPELGVLLERVLMLEFERSFHEAMAGNKFADARELIEATRRKIAGMQRKAAEGAAGAPSEGENLIGAVEPTIAFREFARIFPDPQRKSPAPSQAQLDQLLKQKAEYSKLQRAVNMDLVRHPYLARLLDQGNQDIRLVERWELALRAGSK